MAMAILLQVMLEGLGDSYEPEVPFEGKSRKNIFVTETVDPLFEEDEQEEVAE
jgi:hypothetical protein